MNQAMHNVRVIGVSGPSGSGKSTLSKYLCENLPDAVYVSADKYYKKELPKITSPLDGKEYPDWNHPTSVDFAGMAEEIERHKADPSISYIIADGAFIYCSDEIRRLCDYKIFVSCAIESRIHRRICRNIRERGQTPEFIGGYYLACVRYREAEYSVPSARFADLLVDNELDFVPVKAEILEKCK